MTKLPADVPDDLRDDRAAKRLSSELERTAQRLAQLVADVEAGGLPQDRAQEILSELATGMEELRVAEEELLVQSDQLMASHAAIDAERERYAELFEFAPDGYLVTDEMGKIREANSAAAEMLGVPTRFLGGKLIQSFLSGDGRRLVRNSLAAIGEGTGVQQMAAQLTPRHGEPKTVEIRLGGQYDPAEGCLRVRWLIRDISDRMKLEREVSELHASVELLSALSEVNRLVEEEEDNLSAVLARLVELAQRVAGVDAGVMLAGEKGGVAVRAAAGGSAEELCNEQLAVEGPAVQTQGDGMARSLRVEELGPWPTLQAAAKKHGIDAVIIQPIRSDGTVIGTFNLYVKGDPGPHEQLARLLAENATASISNARVYAGARNLASHLATALDSRGVIDQAKGILMAVQGCGPDEAFDILRRASQRSNVKLRVVAEEIVANNVNRGVHSRPHPPPR